jgi:hypothetical protein
LLRHVEAPGPPQFVRAYANYLRQVAFHSPHSFQVFFFWGSALMNTTARLDDLKRDLARLERKRTGPSGKGHAIEEGRGREAAHPGQIPSRGWMDVLWRAWGEVGEANLFLIAGGVTYALSLAVWVGV